MILLDTAINGMTDVTFNVKDLGIVLSGAIATVTAWLTLKFSFNAFKEATQVKFDTMKTEHDKDIAMIHESQLDATNGRRSIKKELMQALKEDKEMLNSKIDKTNEDLRIHKTEVTSEFKDINQNLNKIIGMLESSTKK